MEGVITALRSHHDTILAGTASSAVDAVDLARRLRREVVSVDIHMPGDKGAQSIRSIAKPARTLDVSC